MATQRLKIKRITETKNLVPQLVESLNAVLGKQVLVGIPEGNADRDGKDEGPINNAALGYIHEFGAPEANIPARPFLIPGVEDAMDRIQEELGRALKEACHFKPKAAQGRLENAGIIASNSAKRTINSNIPPPLKASTIRNRRRGRQTKSRRDSEETYLEMVKGGMALGDAQSAAGIVALVDTGALRNSITSVVRDDPTAATLSVRDFDGATTPGIAPVPRS